MVHLPGAAFADPTFIGELAKAGIKNADRVQKTYEWVEKGIAVCEAKKHFEHKERGISYKRDCSVCNL